MGEFTILWSLAGSSVHKVWEGLDAVIAALMLNYKDVHVVLCGGPECAILEQGWENEKRVHLTCGKWSIRESLAFAQVADLVIGPETGVLNSVACEPMPKVVFLSHSTVENLTRDWVNTDSFWGRGVECKGRGKDEAQACHQMHYGWEHCTRNDDTGTAVCQVALSIEDVCNAIFSSRDAVVKEEAA
jgi:ADP-heptose:LPS heptosyltransferase